jgi:hypothetical protein
MVSSSYTGMPDTMLRHEYQVSPSPSGFAERSRLILEAAFWTATKRR